MFHPSGEKTPVLLALPIAVGYFAFLVSFLYQRRRQRERIDVRTAIALLFAAVMAVLILWAAITDPRLI